MKPSYQKQHAALVKDLLAALPSALSKQARQFAELFYRKMLVSDLEKMDAKHSGTLISSMFSYIETRTPGTPSIRIFPIAIDAHGQARKTIVVEILNDDMPFLVDSLSSELSRHGLMIRETYHPILGVTRDAQGKLISISEPQDVTLESWIHFEVSPLPEALSAEQLERDLRNVLEHIRVAVADWKLILEKTEDRISRLKKAHAGFDATTVSEVKDFLAWLSARNFVFLGYGEYDFVTDPESGTLKIMPSTKLGVLTIHDEQSPVGLEYMPEAQRHRLLTRQLIEITKSNRRSLVHRSVPMDYVGIKRFDDQGNVVGEVRFLGLFTSNVYYQSAVAIPMLRTKIASVIARSGFSEVSHDGKALMAILEFLPRDELFQMSEDDLFETSMGILSLEARPEVRVFVRKDVFERFISAMVFVPRERFSTELRRQIQELIEQAYDGSVTSFNTQIGEAPLARLHLFIRTNPGQIPNVDLGRIEKDISRRAYMWSDLLLDALTSRHDEPKTSMLHSRYEYAFPQSYINSYDMHSACHDIEKSELALASGELELELYQRKEESGFARLKVYNPRQEMALSDILPILENSGFRVIEEQPFLLDPKDIEERIWIRDFKLQLPASITDLSTRKEAIEATLLASWQGRIESDRLNALVMLSDLTRQHVVVLRALSAYLKQIGFHATHATIEQALCKYPAIAQLLIRLFEARFDPEMLQRDVKAHAITKQFDAALEDVTSATDDRILRTYLALINAMLRTNFYQEARPILSMKFNSAAVPDLPLPRPYAEIFVYSPRVEGIHLRGGKVARGGLRWSDRPDDFRTEVLGLMKAQMVKNAVIVPVGSKGGFVLKNPPASTDREAFQKEGIACYTLYLQGLLDLTDNLVSGAVVPPTKLVRHDGDDPYLVVAADKGTATFSDIANGVSKSYGFWLNDAFASGGSVGYDHKKMAITARGAWISVTRHFKELGHDIATTPFTCVGIGDMAGDVFGNGMLLSQQTRLIAAFNHQHIFIDPTPDTATSFQERKRLFELPRSSWKDYNPALISTGGGVYERSAKSINVSAEAKAALGLTKDQFTPDELIRAILLAPVDLLWNGGIGTYVKAEDETHEQVGDRTNNALRVNGKELRCRVVGEGGNLGFTQKGRIEFARLGGHINTDAIDNSAGVDCSDHEVNIKIAFSALLAKDTLSLEMRDRVLVEMTDDVAQLVLKDNTLQTLALSVAQQQGSSALPAHTQLMHALEKKGMLSRTIEYLPNDKSLQEMQTQNLSLTRPELAILLSYSKMDLYKSLIESPLLHHAYFEDELLRYFPKAMQRDYRDAILAHPLKREIIATVLTNSLVNRVGITFVNDIAQNTAADPAEIAIAYALVRDAFSLRTHWHTIDTLTGVIPVALQSSLFGQISRFAETLVSWLVVHCQRPLDVDTIRTRFIEPAKAWTTHTTKDENTGITAQSLVQQGLPQSCAQFIASMESYQAVFDIIQLSDENKIPYEAVSALYQTIQHRLKTNGT